MLDKIEQLFASNKKVFTIADLRIIWHEKEADRLKSQVKYYIDRGKLTRIKRGIYSLSDDYTPFELAGKLIVPSYISLETALLKHALIFQYTSAITSMALYTRTLSVNQREFEYHKLNQQILYNRTGIVREDNHEIASPERAVGDWMYLGRSPGFDNLRPLNKEKLKRIASIYEVKNLENRILKLSQDL